MRYNYIEILNHKVEIPIIQRDYAQGRTDNKTNKIRKDFLDVLFDLIQRKHTLGSNAEIELDFIYGFNEQETNNLSKFIPIDGQQRLTALWLLYWFVAAKENAPDNEKLFLSNFLYETRHSTTEFFKRLIQCKPDFLSHDISKEIKNQAWYFETWDYDPSIQAMLVVLNDIEVRYDDLNIPAVWSVIEGSSCPFYFYKLDMDKVGLTDDLYIKMNSRGKALTEFEYFKAGFTELLTQPKQKERFELSIDGEWIDAVWHFVFKSGKIITEDDIALTVDNSFLNLFNFITSVISFKNDIKEADGTHYEDTIISADLLKLIYCETANQNILFNTLDAICGQQKNDPLFWNNLFYYDKNEYNSSKTRFFFQHKEISLLTRCLFNFTSTKGLSFPEQLLLHGCLTYLVTKSKDFESRIRTIRNLVVNSENELRETTLGKSFDEVENYIINGRLNVFSNFKSDQIDEEKKKDQFLKQFVADTNVLRQLEDSDILRGSISLFPFDTNFGSRARKFLELFDEDEIISDFVNKCNLLLCFGDYSQDDSLLTNLMSQNKTIIRRFFTPPGYNKTQFYSKTQFTLLNCLDYFISNPKITPTEKIEEVLTYYIINPKDWRYYFINYSKFRYECNQGYYDWLSDSNYLLLKMREKRINGYHWDPFLYTLHNIINSKKLSLTNYNAKLILTLNGSTILISTIFNGFQFENGMSGSEANSLIVKLINDSVIKSNGELIVSQTTDGIDLEDRLEKVKKVVESILNEKK